MLATAADHFAGTFDADCLLRAVDQCVAGWLSRVMEEASYAKSGQKEGEKYGNIDVYCDNGEKPEAEWKQALIRKLNEVE